MNAAQNAASAQLAHRERKWQVSRIEPPKE
jgi:hypothetical protein